MITSQSPKITMKLYVGTWHTTKSKVELSESIHVLDTKRLQLTSPHSLLHRSSNSEYVSHAEIVMGRLKEDDDIVEFTKRWRQHFLESMNPQFLPELWCVDHNPRT